jgi:uncharacterized protein YndB with AHSA1/START domain
LGDQPRLGGREDVTQPTVALYATRPEHIKRWFSPEVDLVLEEGGAAAFGFPEHDHTIQARVVRVERPHVFAWRWIHTSTTNPTELDSTLVEFTLADEGGSTRLTVVESGFAGVEWPPERDVATVRASHIEGWERHLVQLDELFAAREGLAS